MEVRFWNYQGKWVGLFLAGAALLVVGVAQEGPGAMGGALPPIVFVSRAHLETLNGHDVGPPVEVIGRETTVGGSLRLLGTDGQAVELVGRRNGIFDVQRPMVSMDGNRVVFSGVRARNGMWRIFEVRINGTGFRQLTPESRGVDIPDDPDRPRQNQSTFGRFGDFSPAYLPDGRIVFSSSRYPSTSASCGQRTLNLYVMDGDGSNLHRIFTSRAGAIDPYVLANGRIVFGLWFDNMNLPSLSGEGMQPLETDANFQSSFFDPWSVNPDGTGAGRLGYLGGFLTHGGGAGLHFREMPNGEIVYTRRATQSLLGSTLATSIAKFRPGDGAENQTAGIGDPARLEAAHALAPTPLPDGRILFSYTPAARVWRDERLRTVAEYNYGLWMSDGDFRNPQPIFDEPDTDELDAVAVYSREAIAITDTVREAPAEDPTAPPRGLAVLINRSIYADVDRRFTNNLAPLVGSVAAIDLWDDSQVFDTNPPQFPLIRKQMPRMVGSFPVAEDGSFRAEIPADKPIIIVLRSHSGVAARYPVASTGEMRTPFFGHEVMRPGDVARCAGCHRGHMIRPEINRGARINLARLAYAMGSSTRDGAYQGANRLNDGHLGLDNGRYQWAPQAGDLWPWVRLAWEREVTVREVVVYPRAAARDPLGEFVVFLSDGKRIAGRSDPARPAEPVVVTVANPGPVRWVHVELLSYPRGGAPGIAEITVAGDPVTAVGVLPPAAPPAVSVAPGTLRLNWARSLSPTTIGYKIFAGTAPDKLDLEWDVGNVTSFQPEGLTAGTKYWFQVRGYDAARVGPGQAQEAAGTVVPPRVDRITPDSGPVYGETEVTIDGADFAPGVQVKIGNEYVRSLRFVSPAKLVGVSYRQVAGVYDVLARNPGRQESVLPRAFRYQ